jgi:radical SAM protein with 4Fe4S-binding SPASM domain
LDEVLRVLGELRAAGCLFLSLTGGEILSYPHLFPVLDRARELNMAVQLLSNGTLLRPGVAAKLAGYRNLLGVSISVYGATPEVHDGITQVKGSWRRTWDGAERLRALGVAVRIKLIVMRTNAHEMTAMRALADGGGYPYLIDVNITSRHDGTAGSLAMRVDDGQLEDLYRGPLRDMVQPAPQAIDEAGFRCNCARGNCAISAHGDVYPCISVPWAAGNVRDTPFLEIWRASPVFQRIRGLKLADDAACLPCPDKPFCSRSRSAAYNASGSYTGVDPFVCKTAALTRRLAGERVG